MNFVPSNNSLAITGSISVQAGLSDIHELSENATHIGGILIKNFSISNIEKISSHLLFFTSVVLKIFYKIQRHAQMTQNMPKWTAYFTLKRTV